MEDYDLVIVGAGSAGCIVANQFINSTNLKVILIEAGPADNNPIISIPLGYGMTFYNKNINWNFYSKKQKNLFNREIYFPRGKVLGGSGSINAMVYSRGLETDYKDWSSANNWNWESIKKIYDKIEKKIIIRHNDKIINKIPVNDVSSMHDPILNNFFKAASELNISYKKNLETSLSDQVGHYNVNTCNGFRYSSSKSFLKPILKNKRLKLLTNCFVKKIYFEKNKVKEIKVVFKNQSMSIKPKLGVILSAGSIMTPYLLMHSGIGNADDLRKFNIKVNINIPNVGKNFQDHLGIDYLFKSKVRTLNYSLGTWIGRTKSILNYLYNRKGPYSLSLNQSGGYINWDSKNNYPNLQLYFNPITYSITHQNKRPLLKTDKFNGFVIGFNSCRPKSLGTISLVSPYIKDHPLIDPNYLDHEQDIHDLKSAINFIKTISSTKNIKKIIDKPINIDPLNSNYDQLIEHFKRNANSVYHPCGTCKMDNDKTKGVVSDKLKVHGAENLWIVDASVLPNITSGNINAPVMMTAYLGSKLIIDELK